MKCYDVSRLPTMITLGYDGENNWRPQAFDCSSLLANHPNGILTLWLLPQGESQAFPVALTRDGNSVVWTPLSEEMTAATGALQIVCTDGTDAGYAAFSMFKLADAIATGTWTQQNNEAASGQDYFAAHLATLKSISYSTLDFMVIHYGTNDFGAGVALDNPANPKSTSTVCGALRYSIETLLTAYPKLRIFVSLPCFRFWTVDGQTVYSDTYTNSQNKTLVEYVEALRSVAGEYNIPVIDNYRGNGINKINASTFLGDGTHHNADGRERFGTFIAEKLISGGSQY